MRGSVVKWITTGVFSFACIWAAAGNALAEEDKPWADASVSAYSKYVWRGFELSRDSIVIQPSATVGWKGFSVNFWGNLDTDLHTALQGTASDDSFNWNETDITLAYERSVGMFTLGGGYIYYDLDELDDSQELFFSVGLDVLLSPTVTVYKEIAHMPSWYINLAVSHSFTLKDDITLDLGASASYLVSDDADAYPEVTDTCRTTGVCTEEFSNFQDGVISAAVSIPFYEYFTFSPEIYFSFPLSGDAEDLIEFASVTGEDSAFVYGGFTLSMAF